MKQRRLDTQLIIGLFERSFYYNNEIVCKVAISIWIKKGICV